MISLLFWEIVYQWGNLLSLPFIIIQRAMGTLKGIKNVVSKCDFFSTTEFLRFKDEPEYQTTLGGALSILLITSLLAAFSNKVVNTLSMLSISSTTTNLNADDPIPLTLSTSGEERRTFMLGVQIWHHNLNDGQRLFDVKLTNMNYNYGQATNNSMEYLLQPCTLQHWKGYPKIQQKFFSLKMNYWLCMPKDTDYQIGGKYSSMESNTLEISVNKCTNSSMDSRPCADPLTIDQYFVDSSQKVFFTIYFLNPLLNPDSAQFLTYYLEDSNYIIFSQTGGEEAQLMMEDYQIETDNSISPFTSLSTKEGGIITKNAIKNRFEVSADNDNYCTFFIYKSPNSIHISRSYQKLDEILSYIGGLFGTLAICLFILKIYNNYSFEVNLGSVLYKHDEEKCKFNKYNFFNFLSQLLFNVFRNKLTPINSWQKVKGYYDCRKEMLKQLDIRYLLKRVNYLERAIEIMLEAHQLKGVHLLKAITLDEAKQQRRDFKLHEKAIEQCEQFQYKRKNSNTTGNNELKVNNKLLKGNRVDNEDSMNYTDQELDANHNVKIEDPLSKSVDSSESDSGSQEEHYNNENTIDLLLRLKKEKEQSSVSKRIYDNLNEVLKEFIDKYEEQENSSIKSIHTIKQDNFNTFLDNNIKTINFRPRKRYRSLQKLEEIHLAKLLEPDKVEIMNNVLQSNIQCFEQLSVQ